MTISTVQLFNFSDILPMSLVVLIFTNLLLTLGFIVGKIALRKAENAVKFFAYFSVFICTTFILYFASILWFSINCIQSGDYLYTAIFPLFIFAPFVIGHFTSYEKVHFYTNIQISTLILSLILAISFVFKGF